jgi:thiol-disulfide isomerase/thioredoxin
MKTHGIALWILIPTAAILVSAPARGACPSVRSDMAVLLCPTAVGAAAPPGPQDANAILQVLREKAQANEALLTCGYVYGKVRRVPYDITGRKPRQEEVIQVHAWFKGDKVRLDWEGLRGRFMRQWRTVLTNDEYREWLVRNNAADIVDPDIGRGKIAMQLTVLPGRNMASSHGLLMNDEAFLSRKITRSDLERRELYLVEVIRKDSPNDVMRCYLDPARGAGIVRYESRYDFRRGPVLVSEADVELQDARNGAWCLKRYAKTVYREDRTVLIKEELEITDFDFKSEISDRVFTWEGMGLPDGTNIRDRRFDGVYYIYSKDGADGRTISHAVNQTLVKEMVTPSGPTAGLYDRSIPGDAAADKGGPAVTSRIVSAVAPGVVKELLGCIQSSKAGRDNIRRLFGLVNKPAPEITAACWLNSEPLSLAKLRGRVVVVEFWNIGCGPCLAGIPELNRIHEARTPVPVSLITVHSYTEDIEAVKRVMSRRNIRYPVCVDTKGSGPYSSGGTFDRYGLSSVPQRFLIDIHGRVRAIKTSVGPELEELVQESADGLVHETEVDLGWMVEVKVVPKRVIFGRVEAGRSVQKSVYIYKPDRPAFAVDLASRPAGPGGAELFRYQAGDETLYELRILLDAAAGGGAYASQARLVTNDPNLPEIAVPITAELAGP